MEKDSNRLVPLILSDNKINSYSEKYGHLQNFERRWQEYLVVINTSFKNLNEAFLTLLMKIYTAIVPYFKKKLEIKNFQLAYKCNVYIFFRNNLSKI